MRTAPTVSERELYSALRQAIHYAAQLEFEIRRLNPAHPIVDARNLTIRNLKDVLTCVDDRSLA